MFKSYCKDCLHKPQCLEAGKCFKFLHDGKKNNIVRLSDVVTFSGYSEVYNEDIKPLDEPDDDPFGAD